MSTDKNPKQFQSHSQEDAHFASKLREALESVTSSREWAAWLGVNRSAVSHWLSDRHIPRPQHLKRIVVILRSHSPGGEVMERLERVLDEPSWRVTPNSRRMHPTIGHYMLGPDRDATRSSLFTLPPRAAEEVLLESIRMCESIRSEANPHSLFAPVSVRKGSLADQGHLQWKARPVPAEPAGVLSEAHDAYGSRDPLALGLEELLAVCGGEVETWSEWLGVPTRTVHRWLRGTAVPRARHLYRLIRILRNSEWRDDSRLAAFSELASHPGWRVTSHAKTIRPTVGHYMLHPLLEQWESALTAMSTAQQEWVLAESRALCVHLSRTHHAAGLFERTLELPQAGAAQDVPEPSPSQPVPAQLAVPQPKDSAPVEDLDLATPLWSQDASRSKLFDQLLRVLRASLWAADPPWEWSATASSQELLEELDDERASVFAVCGSKGLFHGEDFYYQAFDWARGQASSHHFRLCRLFAEEQPLGRPQIDHPLLLQHREATAQGCPVVGLELALPPDRDMTSAVRLLSKLILMDIGLVLVISARSFMVMEFASTGMAKCVRDPRVFAAMYRVYAEMCTLSKDYKTNVELQNRIHATIGRVHASGP